ncbi:MAG: helix-turn-helix domain-containing protein [Chloroflexia bacterium]
MLGGGITATEEPTSFGTWLKQRRKALGLSRQDLAVRVGCSVETIRKLEVDRRRPSKQIAELLAACLDIPGDARPAFLGFARTNPDVEPPPGSLSIPPLRLGTLPAASPPRSRIPTPLTPLIGRYQAVAEVSVQLLGHGSQEPRRLLNLERTAGHRQDPPGPTGRVRLGVPLPGGRIFRPVSCGLRSGAGAPQHRPDAGCTRRRSPGH